MKKLLAAGVASAALCGSAFAADLSRPTYQPPAPLPPAAFSWTGLYVGSHTGVAVGWTTSSNTAPYGGFDAGIPLSYEINPVSIFGGGQIGYNFQTGAFVFGAEFDGGYLGLREKSRPAPDDLVEVKYGWYGTFTGRFGLATDRLLSYVKGGVAVAQIRNTASDIDAVGAIDPTDFSQISRARWGWTAGSGFEYAILPAWSVKSEYLYLDFGRDRSTNLDGDVFEHRNRVHTFKIGLNYHIGSGPLVPGF